MDRLRYARKFALIAVVLTVPMAFVAVSYLNVQARDTSFAQKEKVGVVYLRPATDLLFTLAHARAAAVDMAAHSGSASALQSANAALGKAVAEVDGVHAAGAALKLSDQWSKLKSQIASVTAEPVTTPDKAFADYTWLLSGVESLIAADGNNSNMILDPDNDSYYVMDAVLNRIPALIDSAGQAGDVQSEIAATANVTLQNRLALEDLKGTIVTTLSNSDPDYASAMANTHYSAARSLLSGPLASADSALKAVTDQLSGAVQSGTLDGATATFLAARAQADLMALDRASLPVISHLLDSRIGGLNGASTQTELILTIGVLVAAYLFVAFYLATKATVNRLVTAADGIAEGDIEQSVSVSSRDELGGMATAFGRSVEYLGEMASVARAIAAGNLTVDIHERSERDVLGHAFQEMRARLTTLLSEITNTSQAVAGASQEMAKTSEEASRAMAEIAGSIEAVATGAETQVRALEEARAVTDEVSTATHASAHEAKEAATAAEQARVVAEQGASAVAQATEAMRAVQTTSSQVTGAIRQLGAKSEQIGSIVSTITGIAEQTNLLALNAAIEAARAAEHGRGFAVVAEEVRKLAEESAQAASSISELITEIQRETGKVVEVVELGERQTEEGAKTVDRAREAFVRIDESVQEMNGRVGQIASAIEQIATSGARMEESVAQVAAVAEESSASTEQVSASTQQTSASTQQIAASAQMLAASAETLERLVGQFSLS
jgi:methyl-accepting chemotaxis protein